MACSWTVGRAGVILTDAFDYADGPLVSVGSDLWSNYSGTTGQVQLVSGRILLNQTDSEDVHAPLLGAPYTPVAWPVLYASFTLNAASQPTSDGGYFALFKGGGTVNQRGRIFTGTSNAPPGTYRLGVGNGSTSASAMLTNELSLNTDYTVALRYMVSNATSTLWINPAAETDPGATATDAASATSVSYFAFRQPGSGIGALAVDNLRVGTAFHAVVTNAPQPPAPDTAGALSVMTYNLNGNGKADWSTNTAQAQAIGRVWRHLNPDIVTFNEIPYTNSYQMTNWIAAFLPGYFLAMDSTTDGYVRSGVASRYPITRTTRWLAHANLNAFGYTNAPFTRDLYEAEIQVPDYLQPLHVFTTHLKSTSTDPALYQTDADKRAAEAAAISNFFVNVFLPGTNGAHPCVLTGDLNEDVFRPDTAKYVSGEPVQRLTSASTGLRLATPVNPVTGSELTASIRLPLNVRFDYILPGGLLYSNVAAAEVFRSDVFRPVPAGLSADDSATASDHLPVIMYFRNPYGGPFRLLFITRTNQTVTLNWQSFSNRQYAVEVSSNLTAWGVLASNLTATGTNFVFATNAPEAMKFFRVRWLPCLFPFLFTFSGDNTSSRQRSSR